MPIVTSQPARAASTAVATAARKRVGRRSITWSAAKEPITASGSRASRRAAASPIAAIESRADGSAITASAPSSGSWSTTGVAVGLPGDDEHPVGGQRREPVEGRLDQGAPAAGQVVQELRRALPRQRPEPGAGAAGGDHGPEVLELTGSSWAHPRARARDHVLSRADPASCAATPAARSSRSTTTTHRRAGRAVADDLGQLGGQGGRSAGRGG